MAVSVPLKGLGLGLLLVVALVASVLLKGQDQDLSLVTVVVVSGRLKGENRRLMPEAVASGGDEMNTLAEDWRCRERDAQR